MSNRALLGRWRKATHDPCAQTYPDELEFYANGTYAGSSGDTGEEFTWWSGGGYEVVSGNKLKIQLANDARALFEFASADGALRFEDDKGCVFEYLRQGQD
jgi:hypothetical protein